MIRLARSPSKFGNVLGCTGRIAMFSQAAIWHGVFEPYVGRADTLTIVSVSPLNMERSVASLDLFTFLQSVDVPGHVPIITLIRQRGL